MKFTHAHRFTADFDRVDAMLRDPDFSTERAEAMGSRVSSVDVDRAPDGGFTVMVRASVPTESIPAEARAFIGGELSIGYTEAWEPADDGERVGTFAVDIQGAPGHASGAIGITARDGGTELLATGDVVAHVPLIGAMIERAVHGAVAKAFDAQLASADAWLSR